MGPASRPLCVVLAVLLVFAGGVVDLCACDATSHGTFCADDASDPQASCHGVSAPSPQVAHGCCAGDEPAQPAETNEGIKAAGCGCPVIVLEQSPSESPASSSPGLDRSTELGLSLSPMVLDGWIAPTSGVLRATVRATEPRAPALRRHLELHVLRC